MYSKFDFCSFFWGIVLNTVYCVLWPSGLPGGWEILVIFTEEFAWRKNRTAVPTYSKHCFLVWSAVVQRKNCSDHTRYNKLNSTNFSRLDSLPYTLLMPHVVLHPAALPTVATSCVHQVQALRVGVHRFAAVAVAIAQLLLFPLGRGHFGRVLLAPLGTPVLEPHLPEGRKATEKIASVNTR